METFIFLVLNNRTSSLILLQLSQVLVGKRETRARSPVWAFGYCIRPLCRVAVTKIVTNCRIFISFFLGPSCLYQYGRPKYHPISSRHCGIYVSGALKADLAV